MKLIPAISCLLLTLFPPFAFSQAVGDMQSSHLDRLSLIDSRAVTLVVIDSSTGQPVNGALIKAGDSEFEARTDENGIALLQLPPIYRSVTITATHYAAQTVSLKNSTLITVNLTPDIETPTYRPGSQITNRVAELLGKVYSIDRPGDLGSGAALFIDGIHSLNSSSQPLYIVDGQPWQGYSGANNLYTGYSYNPLSLLDPKNIKSIKILKDGSALYGPKGGNGVVVITTKRADDTPDGLRVNASVGVRTVPARHDIPSPHSLIQSSKKFTDWVGMVTQNAFVSDIGVNYSGGPTWGRYRASLTYNHEDGALRKTMNNSVATRVNTDFKLLSGVTARLDLTYGHYSGEAYDNGLNAYSSPYYIAHIKAPWLSPWTGGNLNDTDGYGIGNPIAILQLGYGHIRRNQFSIMLEPKWEINPHWTLEGQAGYIFDRDLYNQFVPDLGTSNDPLTSPDGTVTSTMTQKVTRAGNKRTTFNADAHFTFTPWLRGDHRLNVTAGGRWRNDTWNIDNLQGYNTGSDNKTSIDDTDPVFLRIKEHYLRWRSLGGYATAHYSWLQRYFLDVTGVIEGSSRFGSKAPGAIHVGGISWGLFPSAAASWLVSDEEFFPPVDVVNKLKINLSYTVTGNDNLPLTAASTFFTSRGVLSDDEIFRLARSGNKHLKWETTGTLRGGVDVGLFSDRITATVDVFMANIYNLMLYKTTKSSAPSQTDKWINGGSMRNVGFSFTASSRLINTPGLKLDLSFMIGGYRNRVTSLDDGSFVTDLSGAQVLTAVGYPVGTFYGVRKPGDSSLYAIGNPNPDAYGNINVAMKWGRFSVNALFTWTAGNDIYNGLRAAVNRQYSDYYYPDSPQRPSTLVFNESMIENGSYMKLKRLSVDYKIPLKWSFIKELTVNFTTTNLFTLTGYRGADPEVFGGSTPMSLGIDNGLLPVCRSFHLGLNIPL